MSKIIYFNINYFCNSRCTFCFSNSTGKDSRELSKDEICKRLDCLQTNEKDTIVLNGGEPTLHSEFYGLVKLLQEKYQAKINVYTNGSLLCVDKLKRKDNLRFIIPIHGTQDMHNAITRVSGLYEKTIQAVKALECEQIEYELKFIVNDMMIESSFDIKDFLISMNFHPAAIVLARLNETDKSNENKVNIPSVERMAEYIGKQKENLKNKFKIKFLDIPFCCLGVEEKDTIIENSAPEFYFNDVNTNMLRTAYYKNIFIGSNCDNCCFIDKCRILKNTYLTPLLDNGVWRIEEE